MTEEERIKYFKTYGIRYNKERSDGEYEYGTYQAVGHPDVTIEYKFREEKLDIVNFNRQKG